MKKTVLRSFVVVLASLVVLGNAFAQYEDEEVGEPISIEDDYGSDETLSDSQEPATEEYKPVEQKKSAAKVQPVNTIPRHAKKKETKKDGGKHQQ